MKILVLNSGSSSQKACLYEIVDTLPGRPPIPLWEGRIEWTGDNAALSIKNSKGAVQKESLKLSSRADSVRHLLHTLDVGPVRALNSLSDIDAVGHRVVHGGPHFEEPVLVTLGDPCGNCRGVQPGSSPRSRGTGRHGDD